MVENKKKEVTHTVVKLNVKNDEFKSYLENMAFASNNLTNVVIYYCRQWFFYTQNIYYIENDIKDFKFHQYDSEKIDDLIHYMYIYNQQLLQRNKKPIDFVKYGLDAYFLHYYFKSINQNDYNCKELSSQTSQQIVKKVTQTFKAFKNSLIDYYKHKDKYKAKPELPKYKKKKSMSGFYFTNQVCTIKNNQIKFPKTKLTLPFTYKCKGRHIRTEVIRQYNEFELRLVFKQETKPQLKKTDIVSAIDLGVNNLVAITTNKGQSLLVKDKSLKSINQFANKEIVTFTYPHNDVKHKEFLTFEKANGSVKLTSIDEDLVSQGKSISSDKFIEVKHVLMSPNTWNKEIGNKHFILLTEDVEVNEPVRGFFNEQLNSQLTPHRKVTEILGSKLKIQPVEFESNYVAKGYGFSETMDANLILRLTYTNGRKELVHVSIK